jgi:high-affinity iron transporter
VPYLSYCMMWVFKGLHMSRRFVLCIVTIILLVCGSAAAQSNEHPAAFAEDTRQALFEAQVALMQADTATAQRALESAQTAYEAGLKPTFEADAANTAERIETLWTQAEDAINADNAPAFAAIRSQLWTALLDGSTQIVVTATNTGDGTMAAQWLTLRDFRTSTRFSRPGADATLAVKALASGTVVGSEALVAVEADLYDTYQGQLVAALSDANEAHTNNFALRQAEEAGLAAGYFEILAPAYTTQRGEAETTSIRTQFAALIAASVTNDAAAFASAHSAIDTALTGFRAAPLSQDQLVRRAGQLVRFSSLIPVDYARGVRNGVVTSDIEVQEALTFHEGATAAFADVESALMERDPVATARIEELLTQALTQIRAVEDPGALQATIDEASTLLNKVIPQEWLTTNSSGDIDVILSVLDQVKNAVAAGDYKLAESARLEGYALLELGVEQHLRGFAPEMAAEIESLFWQGTAQHVGLAALLTSDAPASEVRATLAALETALKDASLVIGSSVAPEAVVGNAAIIVFREGLEAVLILASLIASLRTAEQRRYRQPLVAGAALAFAGTVITWFLATSLLTVLLPLGERLEAVVSLIAIGVLLVITNWFFHKSYWTGWMAKFHSKKQSLVSGKKSSIKIGQTLGLVILGFTSIYREGFETVLFLQSLVLEAGTSIVLQGVALGLLGTAAVGVVTFSLQVRLPYKKMLVVTGVFIGVVLLTMVGNTVHVMQAVGWMPIHSIQGLYLPYWMGQWFGFFATWEGIILQITAGTFVIGSYFLSEHQTKRQRERHLLKGAAAES